jgi:hypothetical protein
MYSRRVKVDIWRGSPLLYLFLPDSVLKSTQTIASLTLPHPTPSHFLPSPACFCRLLEGSFTPKQATNVMARQSQRVRQRPDVQQAQQVTTTSGGGTCSTRTRIAKPGMQQTHSTTETEAITQTQATIETQTIFSQPTAQLVTQKQSLESTKLVVYSSVHSLCF